MDTMNYNDNLTMCKHVRHEDVLTSPSLSCDPLSFGCKMLSLATVHGGSNSCGCAWIMWLDGTFSIGGVGILRETSKEGLLVWKY